MTVTSLILPCCPSCMNWEKEISRSLLMPVLFWTICQRRTRQARMNTQKMIVLTVEFTKTLFPLRPKPETGPFAAEPPLHRGCSLQLLRLLDNSNLPMTLKTFRSVGYGQ